MRLPQRDSAVASSIRVFLYVALPQVLLFITDPQTIELVNKYVPNLLPYITTATPIVALLVNIFLRKEVKTY